MKSPETDYSGRRGWTAFGWPGGREEDGENKTSKKSLDAGSFEVGSFRSGQRRCRRGGNINRGRIRGSHSSLDREPLDTNFAPSVNRHQCCHWLGIKPFPGKVLNDF